MLNRGVGVDKQNLSPLRRDLIRGSGGISDGWFSTGGGDTIAIDTKNVADNAAATYTVGSSVYYVHFTGTQVGTVAFTFPAGSSGINGKTIQITTDAAIGTSTTWTSSGATFLNAPTTMSAGETAQFKYFNSNTEWRRL